MRYHFAAEINTSIAKGETVWARVADLPRKGMPGRNAVVRVEVAYTDGDRPSIRAVGYKARFRAEIVDAPFLAE